MRSVAKPKSANKATSPLSDKRIFTSLTSRCTTLQEWRCDKAKLI